jgi:hypothetical protein
MVTTRIYQALRAAGPAITPVGRKKAWSLKSQNLTRLGDSPARRLGTRLVRNFDRRGAACALAVRSFCFGDSYLQLPPIALQ